MNDAPAITVKNLHKHYKLGRQSLHVLKGASLTVQPGEFLAVVGASGSGKSTLLHMIGLLDRFDKGQLLLHGRDVAAMGSSARNAARCRDIGFVFQFYHLLPELTVLENVMLPAQVDNSVVGWLSVRREMRRRACQTLEQMGLGDRMTHKPSELSGGERQRTAIARALVNRPATLLADEPTGNLDSKTGQAIFALMRDLNRSQRQTMLMVTHDAALAGQADRVVHLRDGRIE